MNLADVISSILATVCHQDRSILLSYQGSLVPMCPRCLAMHGSFFVVILVGLLGSASARATVDRMPIAVLLIALVIMPADWMLAHLHVIVDTPVIRLSTGALAGSATALLALRYVRFTGLDDRLRAMAMIVLPISLSAISSAILAGGESVLGGVLVSIVLSNASLAFGALAYRSFAFIHNHP
jgi:uncharacterized membrane protein